VINHFQSPWQLKWLLFGAQGHEVVLVAVAVAVAVAVVVAAMAAAT